MELIDRIDRMAIFLQETFTSGFGSVSKDDEIADGVNLADEMRSISIAASQRGVPDSTDDLVEAFETMIGVWDSGYAMASKDDFATDDGTVGRIVENYCDEVLSGGPTPA